MEGGEQQVVLNKKYKLLEKIGSGSFGSIYRCTHRVTQARISKPTSTSPPRSYLYLHAGKERKGRWPVAILNQAVPTVPGHP